jgi:GNAT superfamily N-acetyltransferase
MMQKTLMAETDPIVRTATAADAQALGPLAVELGYVTSASETSQRLETMLASKSHKVLVAETTEHEIVGWVHVFGTARVESDSFSELGGLVVTESWRGRGVGARLVAAAERWALEHGYRTMRIRSRTERVDAHRFFNRLGYSSKKTQHVFERPLASDR